jgi:tetratricopeptide (TPR) repeat protein
LLRALTAKASPERQKVGEQLRELKAEEMLISRLRALGNFAVASSSEGDWTKAAARLHEAIAICGECAFSADLHKNLELVLARSGDPQGAISELQEALKLKRDSPDAQTALTVLRQCQSAAPRGRAAMSPTHP